MTINNTPALTRPEADALAKSGAAEFPQQLLRAGLLRVAKDASGADIPGKYVNAKTGEPWVAPAPVTAEPQQPVPTVTIGNQLPPAQLEAGLNVIREIGGGTLDGEVAEKIISGQIEVTDEMAAKARTMKAGRMRDADFRRALLDGSTEHLAWLQLIDAVIAVDDLRKGRR